MMKRCFLEVASALILLLSPPSAAAQPSDAPLEVFVSIPPLAGFVERIGADRVNVHILVENGRDPHTFSPTPRQMVALAAAKLYFQVDAPFDHRLIDKISTSHKQLTIVNTAQAVTKRAMTTRHDTHTEAREPQRLRDNGLDPHIWLSPALIKVQAKNITDALVTADPDNAQAYNRNLAAFIEDVDATDARVKNVLAPFSGRSFYVFHPAFGYFADAYGLKQEAVELEGKSPTPRRLAALIKKAKAENVRIIFVQPQFDPKSAETIATAIGGAVVPMDSLPHDVLANLEEMAAKIEKALNRSPAAERPE